jgi:aryl-phospho-beta-D-glucosidase BglC (GH1 family)
MAQSTKDNPAVLGYDVLNEPVTLAARGAAGAKLWEQASQEAVSAIRRIGAGTLIAVSGYGQTSPGQWGQLHPTAWINDPLRRIVYEAHAYFDSDGSGHYADSYADELRGAQTTHVSFCHHVPDLTRQKTSGFVALGAVPGTGRLP